MISVDLIPALKDNYIAVVREPLSGRVLIVDPSEAEPVLEFLDKKDWTPNLILNTHHHWDHVGGNAALVSRFGCPLLASETDGAKIAGVTHFVHDGEVLEFGTERIRALYIPGHTLGHTAFYFENSKVAFTGDTLFSMGCGRLFEGTASQMWSSLKKLSALPDETQIYCGHEYTEANARFALHVEPENRAIQARAEEAKRLRSAGKPTLPVRLAQEKQTNPFLRVNEAAVVGFLQISQASEAERFARLRELKNTF